jgi:hypothetical protein
LPNPFAKGSEDLKAQSVSSKRDPALAEHFKAMAADPYGTLAKMQDEEVERQSLGGIPYDGEIHKLNPFLGNNATTQAEFVRRDPELAKFYQQEATPVEIPLFGAKRNLTIEGKLFKEPQTAAVLKVTREIQRQWFDQDRAAATEARKAAEEQIARLQSQIA